MLSSINKAKGWLMVIYRLPTTPSTSRVTVWKRIKELGAYLLQQSVYILPNLPEIKESVDNLKDQIQRLGGESKVIEIASLGEEQEKEAIAGFNNNREEEYTEVVKACTELLREIEEESKTEDFHFADLEENEKHIQRVKELLEAVTKRDYFGSSSQTKAMALMKECQEKFEAYTQEVYSREGIAGEDKKLKLEPGKKYTEKLSLTKGVFAEKINELVNKLHANSLEVNGKKAAELSDAVTVEWEYYEHKHAMSLEMRIEWTSVPARLKRKPG